MRFMRSSVLWAAPWLAISMIVEQIALGAQFPELQSVITIERSLGAIAAGDGALYYTPIGKSNLVVTPWNPAGKSRVEKYGNMVDSKRYDLGDFGRIERITGIVVVGERMLLIDGDQLMAFAISLKDYKLISKHSIVMDTVMPAADSRGEPTSIEVRQARKMMRERLRTPPKPAIVGIAALEQRVGEKQSRVSFLVATRLKDFPVLLMSCSVDALSRCKVERQCFLDGGGIKLENLMGIGFDAGARDLYLGDVSEQRIERYRFKSCYHIAKRDGFPVPQGVYDLTNFSISNNADFWFVTNRPDDYWNSSAFQLPAGTF